MHRAAPAAVSTGLAALLGLALTLLPGAAGPPEPADRPAPEFPTKDPGRWFNGAPLAMSNLRGHVVLLEVWTFG